MKIIKIGAIWCPGCLVMKKVWKEINLDDISVTELDLDMDSEEANKYNPGKTLPVVIFLDDNNQELERLIGEKTKEEILNVIDKCR